MFVKRFARLHAVRSARCSNVRSFIISHGRLSLLSYQQDVRHTKEFQDVTSFFEAAHAPAFGRPSQASQPSASPTQPLVAVKVGIRNSLETMSLSRIAIINTSTGQQRLLEAKGRSQESCPNWSPNGQQLAFLSDRQSPGVAGVFVLDNVHLAGDLPIPTAAPALPGIPETLSWSPDGSLLLIQVADHGADQAGALGSDRLRGMNKGNEPSWFPTVQTSSKSTGWRSLWIYEPSTRRTHRVGKPGLNIWGAAWCGQNRVLAVASDLPTEDSWYDSYLAIVDVATDEYHILYRPQLQVGLPTANPSGSATAFVECLSSDRGGVAGQVVIIRPADAHPQTLDLNGVDVTYLQWANEDQLFFMGLRGTQTVAGQYHVPTGRVDEHWASDQTCGPLYPEGAVTAEGGCVLVTESWNRAPKLILRQDGQTKSIMSWAHEGTNWVESQLRPIDSVTWKSDDGLEVQGYLALPKSDKAPYPLILNVHGGPVWAFRNTWCLAAPILPLLVSRGYAVLSANPRGSTGQGPAFMQRVIGDMGGMDARDLLRGVDSMVHRGIADQKRLGVMGVSYGGYMAAWLPTQSPCFAASIPIAPVTNWASYHYTSNIGRFDELFFREDHRQPNNKYHSRSPVMFAGTHPTPVMQVVGAKDHCVPPSQSVEYDRALKEKGVESALVVYPEEGHGIRQYPAYMDFCARVLDWFNHHLRPS